MRGRASSRCGQSPRPSPRPSPRKRGEGECVFDPVRSLTDWTGYIVDRSIAEEGKWLGRYTHVELMFID